MLIYWISEKEGSGKEMDQLVANKRHTKQVANVPFFGLNRQYARYRETFLEITDKVLSTGQVLQGASVEEFEHALRTLTGRRHAVAVGSCTDGIAFALSSLGIGSGDEVLVTAFSFLASASPILRVGATPRFVDIDPHTFMMDIGALERCIGKSTKAIIAVHLFGQSLPMDEVEAIASRYGLALIEDAAQAIGTRYRGRAAGSMGPVSCLSFDPTKVVGSFSSAGAVVTDDPDVARAIVKQRYHGRDPQTKDYEGLGFNSQLSSEMAAMLVFKLSKMVEWESQRADIAKIYHEGLADLAQIQLPSLAPGSTHNWHKFVIRAARRDDLVAALKASGVQTVVHYPKAISDTPVFAKYVNSTEVPEARKAAAAVLSLPIYAELDPSEAEAVVARIREYYDR